MTHVLLLRDAMNAESDSTPGLLHVDAIPVTIW